MIPKVEACLETLQKGVRKIHIIDGRIRHSLMLEIYTNQGIGRKLWRRKPRFGRGYVCHLRPSAAGDHRVKPETRSVHLR